MNGVVPNITDEETSTTIGDSTIALPSHTCHYANQNGTDMNECKASESISPCYKSCKSAAENSLQRVAQRNEEPKNHTIIRRRKTNNPMIRREDMDTDSTSSLVYPKTEDIKRELEAVRKSATTNKTMMTSPMLMPPPVSLASISLRSFSADVSPNSSMKSATLRESPSLSSVLLRATTPIENNDVALKTALRH
ncbi:uncharacterized protein LOC142340042 [Convolutriloba macropyga]|uniref:uncharacterized protein LOC142340042 n=1 Tax=Convolutriloba macropyga TaxID=536237 RepID=UPI003F527528